MSLIDLWFETLEMALVLNLPFLQFDLDYLNTVVEMFSHSAVTSNKLNSSMQDQS